jgi:cobaltochelatase CobS
MPEQVCARIGMPFACVNGRRDLETGELLGKMSVEIDPKLNVAHTVWHNGPVTELCRYGGLFVKDEISRTPSGVNTSLQKLLEDNGKLYVADMPGTSQDKTITPHPWFRFCATDNTALQGDVSGKYASTLVQDESLLDRFDTVVFMDYLDRKHEIDVIGKRAKNLDMQIAEDMVTFAQQVREAYKTGAVQFTLSIRGLIKWATKIEYWGSTERAFYYSFFNKLIDDDQKIIGEMYVKVFGTDPTKF